MATSRLRRSRGSRGSSHISSDDLSRLALLVQTLVENPSNARRLLEFARPDAIRWLPQVGRPSADFREAVTALQEELGKGSQSQRATARDLRSVATRLIERGGVAEEAGRSLEWALERQKSVVG